MTSTVPHYNSGRTILADVIPLAIPYTIQCEVSQICNLSCNYCIQSSPLHKEKHLMDYETFELLCNQVLKFDSKLKQFNFSGWGEPLVNNRLPSMISFLKSINITDNIAIVTNGLLLTKQLSLDLISASIDHIRISLQGMRSDRYFEICGKKMKFTKLIDNIEFLYQHKKQCQISIKLADINMTTKDEWLFHHIFNPISDRTYIEYIRPIFTPSKDEKISKFGNGHPDIMVCPQPFYMISVTAMGDVYPCCSYYDPMKLGNITNIELQEIWKGWQLKDFQLMLLNGCRKKQDIYPVCRKCNIPNVVILPEDELDERREEIKERL